MVAAACLLVPMVGARTRQSRFNHLAGFNKYFPASPLLNAIMLPQQQSA